MAFDVFISYPHQDKPTADAACAKLEDEGIRCWIAPRDVPPGAEWAGAIVDAIDNCRVMILIFSNSANRSKQVHREVQRAFDGEKPVIPFRIENILPEKSLAYYMGSVHWLDALTPPLELHLQKLAASVQALVRARTSDDVVVRTRRAIGAAEQRAELLFVSYASEDRTAAIEIVEELEQRAVYCWIAPRDVRPGKPYRDDIDDALQTSRAMLVILSKNSNASQRIHKEVAAAFQSEKIILPFRIDDANPTGSLMMMLRDVHSFVGFPPSLREQAIGQVVGMFRRR